MKVMCIDASKGVRTGTTPPFKEGEVCEAVQCPVYSDSYEINGDTTKCWIKRRFIPLSTIDETELLHNRQTELV